MISWVINDEKYLTLNLSKKPDDFLLHFSKNLTLQSYLPISSVKLPPKTTPLSVLQTNIIPLPVTMNRKVKNTPVILNFWLSQ